MTRPKRFAMNSPSGFGLPEEGEALVRVSGVAKTYEKSKGKVKVEVLRGLDLTINRRDSVAIVGASGVGKSTLLHVLGAIDRPTAGRVEFAGRDVFALGDTELAQWRNRHVGFVFQFHHLLPEFNALENAMMPGLIAGWSWKRTKSRADDFLKEVGLSHRRTHRVGELSGGEQQRVAVARALFMEPDLLLADEPTGNLDERTASQVHELLGRLNSERNLTTVVVTHNQRLAGMMNRVLTLVDGKVVPWGREV